MANVYTEARPKSRPEGSQINDFVVEDHADHVLGTFQTQRKAITWAKSKGHAPLIARVRHLNDKKRPDHWRVPSNPWISGQRPPTPPPSQWRGWLAGRSVTLCIA